MDINTMFSLAVKARYASIVKMSDSDLITRLGYCTVVPSDVARVNASDSDTVA